jgi:ribosomal protein S18 acetylase RimI-like enzyme
LHADQISLRLATDEDRSFLLRVYGGTREEELSVTDWTREQKDAFIEMQFTAQDTYWREHYVGAEFFVIERRQEDGSTEGIGRLYLHGRTQELRLMDIAILPTFRGQGIGTLLLNQLIERAASEGKSLTIHVEQFNPALALYERLGFRRIGEFGAYYLLEWKVADSEPTS